MSQTDNVTPRRLALFWAEVKKYIAKVLGGKQDRVDDLESIREGAGKGATAVRFEPEQFLTEEQKLTARKNIGVHSIVNGLEAALNFLNTATGKYTEISHRTLSVFNAGKYINTSGQEVANSKYAISAPIDINKGDILVFPSSEILPVDMSFFSRVVTKTYDKVIVYNYTYNADGTIQKAVASHDSRIVYNYSYDDEGVCTITRGGQIVEELQATYRTTESFYEALSNQSVAAMPGTGYVYLCPTTMQIVVSGVATDIASKTCDIYGLGLMKNIASNYMGAPSQRIVAQAFLEVVSRLNALEAIVDKGGHFTALTIDAIDGFKLARYPQVLYGAGTPQASVRPWNLDADLPWDGTPTALGQFYINESAGNAGLYYSYMSDKNQKIYAWRQA